MTIRILQPKNNKPPINLGDLPPELVQEIAQFLPTQSLLRLARTCRALYWLLAPEIGHRARYVAFAPVPLYEENFIYDEGQQHGVDEPVFSLHASYGVPAGEFGAGDDEVLGQAVERGELDIVRGFLKHNIDPNSYIASGERLLGLAVTSTRRRVEMVRLLLEFGADASRPDLITNTTPLVHAARARRDGIVCLLIQAKGDLNADGVMQAIVANCSHETIKMALAYGGNMASISSRGLRVLQSITNRHDACLFNLVKDQLPASVLNARNDVGRTALHTALVGDHSHLAMLLACHPDVDIDVQDMWGYTALHLAIQNEHFDGAHCLIERGASFGI